MPFWYLDSNPLYIDYLLQYWGRDTRLYKRPEYAAVLAGETEKFIETEFGTRVFEVPNRDVLFHRYSGFITYRKQFLETWHVSLPRSIFTLNYTKKKSYWYLMRYDAFFGGFFSHHVPYTAENESESFINGFSFFSLSGKRGWVFCSNELYPIKQPFILNNRFRGLFPKLDAGVLGSITGTQMFEQYRPLDKFFQPRNFARTYNSRLTNHLLVNGRERTEEFFAKFYEQTEMRPTLHIRGGASAATGKSKLIFCKSNFELTYYFKNFTMPAEFKKNVIKGSFINSELTGVYHAFANKAFVDRITYHFDSFGDYFIRMARKLKKFPKRKWRRYVATGGYMVAPNSPLWMTEIIKNIFRRSFFGVGIRGGYFGGRNVFDMFPITDSTAHSVSRALFHAGRYSESLINNEVPLLVSSLTRRFVNSASLEASSSRSLPAALSSRRLALIKKLFP